MNLNGVTPVTFVCRSPVSVQARMASWQTKVTLNHVITRSQSSTSIRKAINSFSALYRCGRRCLRWRDRRSSWALFASAVIHCEITRHYVGADARACARGRAFSRSRGEGCSQRRQRLCLPEAARSLKPRGQFLRPLLHPDGFLAAHGGAKH